MGRPRELCHTGHLCPPFRQDSCLTPTAMESLVAIFKFHSAIPESRAGGGGRVPASMGRSASFHPHTPAPSKILKMSSQISMAQ